MQSLDYRHIVSYFWDMNLRDGTLYHSSSYFLTKPKRRGRGRRHSRLVWPIHDSRWLLVLINL